MTTAVSSYKMQMAMDRAGLHEMRTKVSHTSFYPKLPKSWHTMIFSYLLLPEIMRAATLCQPMRRLVKALTQSDYRIFLEAHIPGFAAQLDSLFGKGLNYLDALYDYCYRCRPLIAKDRGSAATFNMTSTRSGLELRSRWIDSAETWFQINYSFSLDQRRSYCLPWNCYQIISEKFLPIQVDRGDIGHSIEQIGIRICSLSRRAYKFEVFFKDTGRILFFPFTASPIDNINSVAQVNSSNALQWISLHKAPQSPGSFIRVSRCDLRDLINLSKPFDESTIQSTYRFYDIALPPSVKCDSRHYKQHRDGMQRRPNTDELFIATWPFKLCRVDINTQEISCFTITANKISSYSHWVTMHLEFLTSDWLLIGGGREIFLCHIVDLTKEDGIKAKYQLILSNAINEMCEFIQPIGTRFVVGYATSQKIALWRLPPLNARDSASSPSDPQPLSSIQHGAMHNDSYIHGPFVFLSVTPRGLFLSSKTTEEDVVERLMKPCDPLKTGPKLADLV